MDIKNNNEVNYDNNYDTLKNIKENSSIPDFNEDPIEALTKISDEALKNDSNYLKSWRIHIHFCLFIISSNGSSKYYFIYSLTINSLFNFTLVSI